MAQNLNSLCKSNNRPANIFLVLLNSILMFIQLESQIKIKNRNRNQIFNNEKYEAEK